MDRRQKTQLELAFEDAGRGEALRSSEGRVETTVAGLGMESQADTDRLIEEVCEKENLKEALRRVKIGSFSDSASHGENQQSGASRLKRFSASRNGFES